MKCPSVIQKSTAKGSHGASVTVGDGALVDIYVGVDSGVDVAKGIFVDVGKDWATAVCATGAHDVRKKTVSKIKTNCFIWNNSLVEHKQSKPATKWEYAICGFEKGWEKHPALLTRQRSIDIKSHRALSSPREFPIQVYQL